MSKHTPGPWTLVKVPASRTWEIHAPTWRDLADVFGNAASDLHEEGSANARLIAAAPELLEALKAIATKADSLQADPHKALAQIRLSAVAAIIKAEGR